MSKVLRHWRNAIEAFWASNPDVTDDDELSRLLDRLVHSFEAADAFSRLAPFAAGRELAIVTTCIDAHIIARDFHQVIADEKHFLEIAGHLEKAAEELKSFVQADVIDKPEELASLYRYGLQVRTVYSVGDIRIMRRGLASIQDAIASRRRTATETLSRWGTTRKAAGKANVTAAVGYFGESVRRICGQPHEAAAAELASAVLEHEISIDQLHAAERTRSRLRRKK